MVANEQVRYISVDEFHEIVQQPEYEDVIVELVEGEIVIMPKPGGEHGVITMEISGHIWTFVKEHRLGYVTAAETGYVVEQRNDGRDTVRDLDVGFVKKERAPEGLPGKPIPFVPDLAVEVVSPNNDAQDMQRKVLQLLHAGTELVWLVFPELDVVMEYRPGSVAMLTTTDTLDGAPVLPGFKLPVKDVFDV